MFIPCKKVSTTWLQLCDLSVVLDNEVKTLKFVIKCFQFIERGVTSYLDSGKYSRDSSLKELFLFVSLIVLTCQQWVHPWDGALIQ